MLQAKRTSKTARRGIARPGGRTERVRRAVLGAVLDRLQAGDCGFSFQDIAKASGVHVATIYARWPDRVALVMAAYELHARKLDMEFSGDWEADLRRLAFALREFLKDPVEMTANKLLITSGDEVYREQMRVLFMSLAAELARPISEAQQAGKVRPEADPILIVQMLIAQILTVTMFTSIPLEDEIIARIADHLIHACRA